uniref:Uncharacterized protein n=1 Tax=Anguilla anguilla TaxID=7936 RepID=A0A0E9PZI6_ANGAN
MTLSSEILIHISWALEAIFPKGSE